MVGVFVDYWFDGKGYVGVKVYVCVCFVNVWDLRFFVEVFVDVMVDEIVYDVIIEFFFGVGLDCVFDIV